MYIIEPCCAERQMNQLRRILAGGGTERFEGYGDLSLTELLPAILMRYSETELVIAAPSLPDQAAEVVARWLRWKWARADGRGTLDVIARLTVIADLSEELSPMASQWLEDNPFGERLTLCDARQDETAILLPDFAVTGPVNMRYGRRFTATATTDAVRLAAVRERLAAVTAAAAAGPEVQAEERKPARTQRSSRAPKKRKR